jgi:hypothetical protein
MIYNFGVHLEFKAAVAETSPPTIAGFPVGDSQSDLFRLLTDQFASLTATNNRNNRGRDNRNDNDRRDRNDNDRRNRNDNDRRNRNDNDRRNRNDYKRS